MVRYLSLLLVIRLTWGQTTIAVFDFEQNNVEEYIVRQLSTRLESELSKIGGFQIVERSRMDDILS